jgi:hypothetical protein
MLNPSQRGVSFHFVTEALAYTLAEAWQTCDSGSAMIKLCGAMVGAEGWPTAREIITTVCECIETTFGYLPRDETRPQECVRSSRLWAEGKATIDKVEAAIRMAIGTPGPIVRSGIVWSNAAMREIRAALRDVPCRRSALAVASGAYCIADATLDAADAEKSAAWGDVTKFVYHCRFWQSANAAIALPARAVADAREASEASSPYSFTTTSAKCFVEANKIVFGSFVPLSRRANSKEKEFADIVRAKLHPEGLESYHRMTIAVGTSLA